ncbi:MAG: nucleoside recognition protein [bacterium]|nr:nucleoside recognition protein [bacterium]
MLNYLWAGMMAVGIIWGAAHGNLAAVTNGALDSAKEAVTLCITMLGIMSFWNGILEVGNRAGLIGQIAEKMRPILKFLFPKIPEGHPVQKEIATNMIANILGLGWAATPAGLRAMEQLENLEEERRKQETYENDEACGKLVKHRNDRKYETYEKYGKHKKAAVPRGTANNEMCTFLVLNISSLQLIPVNMIAYRSQYGSMNPTVIVGPAIVATVVSTIVGVIFCKIMGGRQGY